MLFTTKNSSNFLFIAGSCEKQTCKNSSNKWLFSGGFESLLLSDKRKKFASQIFYSARGIVIRMFTDQYQGMVLKSPLQVDSFN